MVSIYLIARVSLNYYIIVCDPVMGDNGKLYVPQESADVYRDEIVPIADFVTPNQFECE